MERGYLVGEGENNLCASLKRDLRTKRKGRMEKLCSRSEDSSVGFDALNHGEKAIGTRGREVFAQTDGLHKIEVGVANLSCGVTIDHTQEEGDNAFDNEGITLGSEGESAVVILVANNPHTTLTSVDEIGFYFF